MKQLYRSFLMAYLAFAAVLTGQSFPPFEHRVLDINSTPADPLDLGVTNFLPTEDSAFLFSLGRYYPNPVYHWTGTRLDSILLHGLQTADVYARYAGGLLLYATDDRDDSGRTYHLDPVTRDTVFLYGDYLNVSHVFPDGKRLLRAGARLFSIGDTPASFIPLGAELSLYSSSVDGVAAGDYLVYAGADGTYATDGTPAGTVRLTGAVPFTDTGYGSVNGRAYWLTGEGHLATTDGTQAGTSVNSVATLSGGEVQSIAGRVFPTGAGPVFLGRGSDQTLNFYFFDEGGPQLRPLATTVGDGVAGNGRVIVFRGGEDDDLSIRISDGTPAGTRELMRVDAAAVTHQDWQIHPLASLADGTFYFHTDYSDQRLLWTVTPTGEVSRLELPAEADPNHLATRTALYVTARYGETGIYRHRAGAPALERLTDRIPAYGYLKLADGGILHHLQDLEIDGATATLIDYGGTLILHDEALGIPGQSALPSGNLTLQQRGDRLYGIGMDQATGKAIVSIDLRTGTQTVVQDLGAATESSDPHDLQAGDGAFFFKNGDDFYGSSRGNAYELLFTDELPVTVTPLAGTGRTVLQRTGTGDWYLSDGTRAGTVLLARPGVSPLSAPAGLGSDAYFIGSRYGAASKIILALIKLDGRTGTFSEVYGVEVINTPRPEREFSIASSGSRLYFSLPNKDAEWAVWSSDGSPQGTRRVTDIPAAGRPYQHAFNFRGSGDIVTFQLASIFEPEVPREHYYLREGSDVPQRYTVAYGYNDFSARRVAGQTLTVDDHGLLLTPDAGGAGQRVFDCDTCFPGQLTVIDASTVLFTAFDGTEELSVYRLTLPQGSVSRLMTEVFNPYDRADSLVVLDSLLLIPQDDGSDVTSYNVVQLVNVHSGQVTSPDGAGRRHFARELAVTGNRFMYLDDHPVYGDEVFTITFAENPGQPTATAVAGGTAAFRIEVYPNPTTRDVTVDLPERAAARYRILSSAGRVLQTGILSGAGNRLALDGGWPAGMYVLHLLDAAGRPLGGRTIVVAR